MKSLPFTPGSLKRRYASPFTAFLPWGALLFIVVFHILTLEIPVFWDDDGPIADLALHGHTLTRSYFHFPTFANDYLYIPSSPAYFSMLRLSMHALGANVHGARAPSLLAGLACLFLLFWLVKRWTNSATMRWPVLALGLSALFFLCMHEARGETIILLCLLINLLWLMTPVKGRIAPLLAGGIGAWGFAVYYTAVFFLVPTILIGIWRFISRPEERVAWLWWCVGAGTGLMLWTYVIDVDVCTSAVQFIRQTEPLIMTTPWIMRPYLLWSWIDYSLPRAFGEAIFTHNPFQQGAMIIMLSAFFYQLNHWKELKQSEKTYSIFLALLILTHGATTVSTNPRYAILMQPLLFLQAVWVGMKVLNSTLKLNLWDYGIPLFLYAILIKSAASIPTTVSFLLLLRFCLDAVRKRPAARLLTASGLVFFLLLNADYLVASALSIRACLTYYPFILATSLAVTLLVSFSDNGMHVALSPFRLTSRPVGVLLSACLLLYVLLDVRETGRFLMFTKKPAYYEDLLSRLHGAQRIVGPSTLWLYASRNTEIQDPAPAIIGMTRGMRLPFLERLSAFNPERIFLFQGQYDALQRFLKESPTRLLVIKRYPLFSKWANEDLIEIALRR